MQDVMKITDVNGEGEDEGAPNQKPFRAHTPEKWEINVIGNFLFELIKNGMLTSHKKWEVEKYDLRQEYCKYMSTNVETKTKLMEVHGTGDIGTLLYRTNFLSNTPRGSSLYRIKDVNLLYFRHEKLAQLDEKRMSGNTASGVANVANVNDDSNDDALIDLEQAIKEHTIDADSQCWPLAYQGTARQKRLNHFNLSSFGCIICQRNFDQIDLYEDHVEYHSDESDFKSTEALQKQETSTLKTYYQLCVKSHYFCFTIETSHADVIIDKIVIVQSRSFYYVESGQLPYEMQKGKYQFFVDSHLFTISKEQPIVIVFRHTNVGKIHRFVEQHHFLRSEPFPLVNFSINPFRLSYAKTFKPKFKLEHYMPDKDLITKFANIPSNEALFEMSAEFKNYYTNKKCLTLQNIWKVMEILLRVEDIENMNSYRRITQTNVKLDQIGREITMKLDSPKMANVLGPYDDVVMIPEAKQQNDNIDLIDMMSKTDDNMRGNKRKVYFGRVERVNNCRAMFESTKIVPNLQSYTVLFRPNRLLIRRQYRALQLLKIMGDDVINRFLFPTIDRTMQSLAGMFSLDLNDKSFYDNPEQFQAIQRIAKSNRMEAPYIIFGPPGTGKTATVVEAIIQLYKQRSDTKILIMAGSNSACDEIALRLLQFVTKHVSKETKTLTRIFSQTNDSRVDNIDELLLDYSNMYGAHFYPNVEMLHMYRIVVCTLAVAGKLATGGFGKDVSGAPIYTHIFVDEAAATTEAETLMGLVCAMSPSANLILSGDHKQLGPIVKSNRASDLGLTVSLMERLLQRECYKFDEQDGSYDRSVQTRLIRNYRSHKEIVKLYSQLYYNDKLLALANPIDCNFCENWFLLPNPKFPIIFHAEFGTSERGSNSVSLCNNREIDTVLSYVSELMHFGVNGQKLKQSDIGIISPYKNQYMRIQEQLNLRNWHHIECGAVETFQGKEKLIIIVSFVRSFSTSLGFLDNPRRLNVTLSRPKSLLILIGNPHTLGMHSDYKFIIDMCKANNTCIGAKIYNDYDPKKYLNKTPTQQCQQQSPQSSNNKQSESAKQRKQRWWLDQKNKQQQKMAASTPKAAAESKSQPKAANGAPSLGQTMKKRVNPISQEKQRRKAKAYNRNIQKDLDALFDDLPSVPQCTKSLANAARVVKQHNANPARKDDGNAKFNVTINGISTSAKKSSSGNVDKLITTKQQEKVTQAKKDDGIATSNGASTFNDLFVNSSEYTNSSLLSNTPNTAAPKLATANESVPLDQLPLDLLSLDVLFSDETIPIMPVSTPKAIDTAVATSTSAPTISPTVTAMPIPTGASSESSPIVTQLPSATVTAVPSPTVSAVPSPAVTAVPRPTVTAVPSPAVTAVPRPTVTAVPRPTVTAVPSPTVTAVPRPTVTAVPRPAVTAVPSPTVTAVPRPAVTAVPSPTVTAVPRPAVTAVPSPTVTAVPGPTVTAVPRPTVTAVPRPPGTLVPRSPTIQSTPSYASSTNHSWRATTVNFTTNGRSSELANTTSYRTSAPPTRPPQRRKESGCIIA